MAPRVSAHTGCLVVAHKTGRAKWCIAQHEGCGEGLAPICRLHVELRQRSVVRDARSKTDMYCVVAGHLRPGHILVRIRIRVLISEVWCGPTCAVGRTSGYVDCGGSGLVRYAIGHPDGIETTVKGVAGNVGRGVPFEPARCVGID